MSHTPVIGILGGMGPAATADFYSKLVALTPGASDQDHPKVVIWADPTIPDRTLALTHNGPDPTPWLLRGADVLRTAGATMLAIPCNTAHAFLPPIAERLGLPLIHMIDQVARHIRGEWPTVTRVGLMATTGTVGAGLYQQWLDPYGIEVVTPDEAVQQRQVMPAILDVKAGRRGKALAMTLADAATHLTNRGAQIVVAGCTEIPLGLTPDLAQAPCPLVDPAMVLATALLDRATTRTPREAAVTSKGEENGRAGIPA